MNHEDQRPTKQWQDYTSEGTIFEKLGEECSIQEQPRETYFSSLTSEITKPCGVVGVKSSAA
jgi:hypothetical protein